MIFDAQAIQVNSTSYTYILYISVNKAREFYPVFTSPRPRLALL